LHVKAGDVLGNWSPELAPITIKVLPAFYETIWFKLALIIVLASMLYVLYWYRINQLMRLQRVRNRISADLHDELGSSLSGISIMGTLAKSKLESAHPSVSFVDRIVEEVQLISGSLDDIVWNISPRNDSLSSLIARMTRYASELFEARQIHYTFTLPNDFDNITLSMEQRRNFYLIFKESINNLIKYSRCTQASVLVSVERKKIKMLIKDDGVGFDTGIKNDRNGLVNMKARAASLNGVLHITSSKDEGTTLQLDFALS
jgi:signal transduction histidine kinase